MQVHIYPISSLFLRTTCNNCSMNILIWYWWQMLRYSVNYLTLWPAVLSPPNGTEFWSFIHNMIVNYSVINVYWGYGPPHLSNRISFNYFNYFFISDTTQYSVLVGDTWWAVFVSSDGVHLMWLRFNFPCAWRNYFFPVYIFKGAKNDHE